MPNAENLTAREELEQFAELLREADENEKEWKAAKESARGPFLELISEVVRDEISLDREVVEIPNQSPDEIEAWRKVNYPLYRIVGMSVDPEDPDTLQITLEENDEYRKFEFSVGGYKFGRTVKMKDKGFEAEAFVATLEAGGFEVEPEVLERLQKCINKEIVTVYSANEAEMSSLMTEYPETVAIFQEFINPGVPQVALLPIKAVKDTEE